MPQFLVAREDVRGDAAEAVLRGDEAKHLLLVLRARPGDPVLLFDGAGNRWQARLAAGRAAAGEARLEGLAPLPPNESPVRITLVQSVPRKDRWEWILEKGTELGAARFVPVQSCFSVALVAEDQKPARLVRWRGIAAAAAKQCERGVVPTVDAPVDLREYLAALPPAGPGELRLLLEARLEGQGLPETAAPPASVLLAVGPEGGWSPEEAEAFRQAGFVPLDLGRRVLRAETAAVAGLATVHLRWGELSGRFGVNTPPLQGEAK